MIVRVDEGYTTDGIKQKRLLPTSGCENDSLQRGSAAAPSCQSGALVTTASDHTKTIAGLFRLLRARIDRIARRPPNPLTTA